MIYVVATPIGNLADISSRAVEVLRTVDCIAAEDTRHSGHLLKHLQINTKLIALHEHNEREQAAKLLASGKNVALISDAGTPLISDPGYHLVRLAHEQNITVVPIPGPCAAITALSVSGLPTNNFSFEGFLPAKAQACRAHMQELAAKPRTMIFYEAPHRILTTLQSMVEIFGADRQATFCRELTKQFETVKLATLAQLLNLVQTDPNQQRGEIVLVVAGHQQAKAELDPETMRILKILLEELTVKQAAALAAKITNVPKNMLYDAALRV